MRSGSWRNAFVASVSVTASYRPARWLARRSSSTCSRWTRSREARMASHTSALPKFSRSPRSSMLRSSQGPPTVTPGQTASVAPTGEGHGEARPALGMVLGGERPAVAGDHTPGEGEADPGAGGLGGSPAAGEHVEDQLLLARTQAGAVVADADR